MVRALGLRPLTSLGWALAFACTAFAGTASADEASETRAGPAAPFESAPSLELALTGDLLLATGDFCTMTASDVADCNGRIGYTGVGGQVRSRLWDAWSFGIHGAYDFSAWTDGIDVQRRDARVQHRMWRIGADARYHLRGNAGVDPFLELDAGVAKSWTAVDGESESEARSGQTVPSFGAAFGVAFALGNYFALGPEFRVLFLPFPEQTLTEQRLGGSALSGPVVGFSLGATLAARYPFQS